jgi:kynureninase
MILSLASAANLTATSKEFAEKLDQEDELKEFRNDFLFPAQSKDSDIPATYLCGNSLGIQPKKTRDHVLNQLDKWGREGVEGHFTDPTPWLTIDDIVMDSMARLVGALPSEIVLMNSLTVNLHLMMVSFYKPTAVRHKILIEKKAFPSDVHAVVSQIQHHKLDPSLSLLEIGPREGETLLRTEDIEALIAKEGDSIALVVFSGVQYYTGQLFDMGRISAAAKAKGCNVGFDLAHAVGTFILSSSSTSMPEYCAAIIKKQTVSLTRLYCYYHHAGNVPLKLHEWGCDFACWCTYKYMNCGPGSIGGCFIHDKHSNRGQPTASVTDTSKSSNSHFQQTVVDPPRFAGWWGHRLDDRFVMDPQFIPCEGAYGFRLSNPPVLLIAGARASLDLFDKVRRDLLVVCVLLISLVIYTDGSVRLSRHSSPVAREGTVTPLTTRTNTVSFASEHCLSRSCNIFLTEAFRSLCRLAWTDCAESPCC